MAIAQPPTPSPPRDERLGYMFMIGSSLSFALMGFFVKLASATVPFYELCFFRSFGGLLVVGGIIAVFRLPVRLREKRLLVARGVLGLGGLMLYFLAIAHMPLADAMLLTYTSPFFTALLAALILGERLGWRGAACMAVAGLGVAAILGPAGHFANWGALAGLGSAFFAGLAYVAVRRANASNTPWVIVGAFSLVASVLTLPLMVWDFHPPTPGEWALLTGVAGCGTLAQILMTFGYRHARAGAASVLTLVTPMFAAGLAVAFLGAVPGPGTWAGAALILGAGWVLFKGARPAPGT